MEDSKKVLCVIRHVIRKPYLTIHSEGQEKTWLADPIPDNCSIIHVFGNPPGRFTNFLDNLHETIRLKYGRFSKLLRIFEDFITSPLLSYVPKASLTKAINSRFPAVQIHFLDTYLTIRWKFIGLFAYFINNTDADYIFITTTNGYVRLKTLMGFTAKLPQNNVYTGAYTWEGSHFVSGCNIILSRDVVLKLLNNKRLFRAGTIDDVELARVLGQIGIRHFGHPLINISTYSELSQLSNKTLIENYHFRMKSGPISDRSDVILMHQLHDRYRELG